MEQISMKQVWELAHSCAMFVVEHWAAGGSKVHLVGVPRGGVVAAIVMSSAMPDHFRVSSAAAVQSDSSHRELPLVIVEDIIVTGSQARRAYEACVADGVVSLVSKGNGPRPALEGVVNSSAALVPAGQWVQFPWEAADPDAGTPEDAVRRLIEYVGDDPAREGLVDTPRRVLAYLDEVREGGKVAVEARTFASASDDLLVVSGIALSSLCEHHMLPYQGTAAVAYIPQEKLLGLSKIARLVQQAASGLTVQEDLTRSIAERVIEASGSPDVAVVTEATHSCMIARGVRAVGSETLASAMLGRFRQEDALRAEALALLVRR